MEYYSNQSSLEKPFANEYLSEESNVQQELLSMGKLCETYGASIFFKRWVSTIVDYLLLAAYFYVVISQEDRYGETVMMWVMFGGILFYYWILEGFTGYTLGKFLLRIQVVNEQGRPPGVFRSLIRTILRLVDTNPILLGGAPAGIMVLVSRRKQRIGDMLARTYVVQVRDLK